MSKLETEHSSPEHFSEPTRLEKLRESTERASESASYAAITGDDETLASALKGYEDAQRLEVIEALSADDLGVEERSSLEFLKTDLLERSKELEVVQQTGEITPKIAKRLEYYRESVLDMLDEVIDGKDDLDKNHTRTGAARVREHYRGLAKQAARQARPTV